MRRAVLAILLATTLVASGCSGGSPKPVPSAATSSGSTRVEEVKPGADGAGDPYFPKAGNGGYDVASYQLTLRYDPGNDTLTGRAVITATASTTLSAFNLDFTGLTVDSVRVDDADTTPTRQGAELTIPVKSSLSTGRQFTVDIAYHGVPSGEPGDGFAATSDGAIAVGEPTGASTWFPVNDHPSDKATYTIAVTVPAGLAALSNGTPVGTSTVDGWTTWTWAERQPMASYLATVVIGNYRVKSTTHGGKPVVTAVASSIPAGTADTAMARTPEVVDFLATQFGPYPFDALGGIVHNERRIGYALENQARPVYSNGFFETGANAEILAHELAHQWFGDSVSVAQWKDVWLNEGFATYAQWLWNEHERHIPVADQFNRVYNGTRDSQWAVPTADPSADMFSKGNFAIYQRGAMALYALRRLIGDSAFTRLLTAWPTEKRGGNGTTDEFLAMAEKVSGKSVRAAMQPWLFGTTRPTLPPR